MKNNMTFIAILVVTALFGYLSVTLTMEEKKAEKVNPRGIAISAYLLEHHQQVVDPEQAQYLDIQLNTFNLSVKDMDIFITKVKGAM